MSHYLNSTYKDKPFQGIYLFDILSTIFTPLLAGDQGFIREGIQLERMWNQGPQIQLI